MGYDPIEKMDNKLNGFNKKNEGTQNNDISPINSNVPSQLM